MPAASGQKSKGNTMHSAYDTAAKSLGGDHEKPKKEIKEVRTRKGKSGGFIHEHHHTHSDHHPVEEHTSANDQAMMAHMAASMGQGAAPSGDPSEVDPASAGGDPAAAAGAAPAAAAPPAAPGA